MINADEKRIASVDIVAGGELSEADVAVWRKIKDQNPLLNSGYYAPDFTRAVARARNDVQVAFFRNPMGEPLAILPFQRISHSTVEPVGGRLNDMHCIIKGEDVDIDLKFVLAKIGARRMKFHAWTDPDETTSRFCFEQVESHFVDLSGGLENYLHWLEEKNSSSSKRLANKTRSFHRDFGEPRFEFLSYNSADLERLIEMKRNRYQLTRTFDILSVDWAAQMLREIAGSSHRQMQGVLSVLWAGENLAAAHFGMRSNNVLHYWFPVYDPRFSKYSPGLQLMMQTLHESARIEINKIDMSYGDSVFKTKFCNDSATVGIGSIDFNPVRFEIAKRRYQVRKKLKSMPFKSTAKVALRNLFPGYGKWHYK